MEPFVSVVTPVFNGGRWLEECIESVLRQTYTNWEYIIVDNASTDGTLDIANRYATRDQRVRVVHSPEHRPIIANWNYTLRLISAISAYTKMVHADDFLFPECLSRMVDVGERHPSVGLVGALSLYGDKVKLDGLPYGREVFPGREVGRDTMTHRLRVLGCPTALLMRSSIVRSRPAFYDEGELHADRDACLRVLKEWDFGYVHQVLTYNRVHSNSVMFATSRPLTVGRLTDLSMLRKHGADFLDERERRDWSRRLVRAYYNVLALNAFRGRGKGYWRFQRERLAAVGLSLSAVRLSGAMVRVAARSLVKPRRTWRAMRRWWGSARSAQSTA